MEYLQQFETIANRIVGLPSKALMNCFISGLKVEIQRELADLHPHSLSHAIGLAKLIEAKINDSRPPPHRFVRHPTPTNPPNPPPLLAAPPQKNTTPIRYVTSAQQQERRSKGLGFYCDEKYGPTHRC